MLIMDSGSIVTSVFICSEEEERKKIEAATMV